MKDSSNGPTELVKSSASPVHPCHPLGVRARVLLTSVFGPYARNDEYGSRAINPMELYHNQVTRVQGAFSLRMFHRSWGLMLIRDNIDAPCALLDFPDLDRFVREIRTQRYDIVGISSISMNVEKVKKMCQLIRRHLPDATIVVGGHVANLANISKRVDADHIVRGDGVRWMRRFLSEDEDRPIRHPHIIAGIGTRAMGVRVRTRRRDRTATLIPSVGCPIGCNFCSTSSMFGGKGKFVNFYDTGDELFRVMCELERVMNVRRFFVMDENFLLHRKRALRLLDLMADHDKSWVLYVFSSARVLSSYSVDQLVGLGISWAWMGLEGEDSEYAKVRGVDTHRLVRLLQDHGISVLGSTIIGLEEHRPDNIDETIEYAVRHDTDFHQFMLYTAVPGTPLYAEQHSRGTLLRPEQLPEADSHGQYRFNFVHPHIRTGQETEFLLRAFHRDYAANGPSVIRMARTLLQGWRRYKNHPEARIRRRIRSEARELPTTFAGALWAAKRWFRADPALKAKIGQILDDVQREFGVRARVAAPVLGRFVEFTLAREERRLRQGRTCEPPTFYEAASSLRG